MRQRIAAALLALPELVYNCWTLRTTIEFTLTSIQAPNQDKIGETVSAYLGSKLGLATRFVNELPWQERERRLDAGEIQAGWICGLPYVRKKARSGNRLELLAAPVMSGARYGGKSVYFSDVVVRADSPYRQFGDLRGSTWAYNEPGSQSGYNVTRWHLVKLGEGNGFFGKIVAAGNHQRAIDLVLDGTVDGSAIDSTVLEIELSQRPKLNTLLRVIEVLGPSPIPPWVISRDVPEEVRQGVRETLLGMHLDPEGSALLARIGVARFVPVSDADYDAIREMARLAASLPEW